MGSECLEDVRRHTVVTSRNGWLKAWNKSRGIALHGEDRYDVRHRRKIITSDGIGKKKDIVLSSCHHSFHMS